MSTGRHQLYYKVQVLVNGASAGLVQDMLKSSVSCAVTSVTRGCSHVLEVYDSNFFVANFDSVSCPDLSKLVTHIPTSTTEIFLHHVWHFQRLPCFICYSLYYSIAICGGRNGIFQARHHREFTSVAIALPHASGLTFNHLYVACRLHQCLWAGGHFGGNHGEVKSDNDGALF